MSDEKAATMEKENEKLNGTVNVFEADVNELKRENKLRESILDIQLKSEVYIHLSQIHLYSIFHNS